MTWCCMQMCIYLEYNPTRLQDEKWLGVVYVALCLGLTGLCILESSGRLAVGHVCIDEGRLPGLRR
jgi:hypothetical protein